MRQFITYILSFTCTICTGSIIVETSGIQTINCNREIIEFTVPDSTQYQDLKWRVIEVPENGVPTITYYDGGKLIIKELKYTRTIVIAEGLQNGQKRQSNPQTLIFRPTPDQDKFEFDFPGAYIGQDGLKTITICKEDSIEISYPINNSPNNTYTWSNGETTNSIYVKEDGIYGLDVQIGTQTVCSARDTIKVVTKAVNANFDEDSTILCQGESKTLSPNYSLDNLNYNWNNGLYDTKNITVSDSNLYTVIASLKTTQGDDCADSASIRVDVIRNPKVYDFEIFEYSELPTFFDGVTSDSIIYSYEWKSSFGDIVSEEKSVEINIIDTAFFLLISDTINNCTSNSTLPLKYLKEEIPTSLKIPNILLPQDPNPDNASFRIYGEGFSSENFKMEIYDRWGNKVYETSSIEDAQNIGWTGRLNNTGDIVQPGSYTYKIEGRYLNGSKFDKIGSLTLAN